MGSFFKMARILSLNSNCPGLQTTWLKAFESTGAFALAISKSVGILSSVCRFQQVSRGPSSPNLNPQQNRLCPTLSIPLGSRSLKMPSKCRCGGATLQWESYPRYRVAPYRLGSAPVVSLARLPRILLATLWVWGRQEPRFEKVARACLAPMLGDGASIDAGRVVREGFSGLEGMHPRRTREYLWAWEITKGLRQDLDAL